MEWRHTFRPRSKREFRFIALLLLMIIGHWRNGRRFDVLWFLGMVLLIGNISLLLLWLVNLGLLVSATSILRGDCVHFNLFLVIFGGSGDISSLVAMLLGIDSGFVHL